MTEIQSKIQEIKSKIKILKEEINKQEQKLKILEQANAIISGESQLPFVPSESQHKNGSKRTEISILDAVEAILKEAGHALHASEINKKLLQDYGKKVHKYSVSSAIIRSMQKNEGRFTRASEPNTFALKSKE